MPGVRTTQRELMSDHANCDRRNSLPELATFGPPDPLLLLLSRSVGCYYLPTVDCGLDLPVYLTKDFHIVRPRWTAGFELLFEVGFQRAGCPLTGGTAF